MPCHYAQSWMVCYQGYSGKYKRLKMEGLRMERAYDRDVAKYQQQQQ